jgi:O-methyltransferase involved in polyketide biosynthesis
LHFLHAHVELAAVKTVPNLTGVPETMLWMVYNRAIEAKRADRILDDPESIRIFESLDYDFTGCFGAPNAGHAGRAVASDRVLRAWMMNHPGGTVVSLGEGLDTQALRVDDGGVRWISVDVPEAIAVRSRFLPETDRRRHISKSALDLTWMDEIDASRDVFVVALGLLMYFDENAVRTLIAAIAQRLKGATLFFDTMPRWFSALTLRGAKLTRSYKMPPMPWGINTDEIEPFLRACSPRVADVALVEYRIPRGWLRVILDFMGVMPVLRNKRFTMVHVRFTPHEHAGDRSWKAPTADPCTHRDRS